MEKQGGFKHNLKYRSYLFSLRIIHLLKQIPNNYINIIICKQLLRSATSVGANIIEAQAGRTKKDFANFYQISLKSSNETKYWLCLLRDTIQNDIIKQKIITLLNEIIEISNMLAASIITLKKSK